MIKKILMCILLMIFSNNFANATDMLKQDTNSKNEEIVFAMGCFWCAESEFRIHDTNELLPGIVSIRVGYAGGVTPHPVYESHEGYKEAIKIVFDPSIMKLSKLLNIFWHNVDLFDAKGQFCDKGFPYTSVIFYKNEVQKVSAMSRKIELEKSFNKPIATEITKYTTFYDAEEYHQDYKSKNPIRYNFYRWNCGRDKRLSQIWNGVDLNELDQ